MVYPLREYVEDGGLMSNGNQHKRCLSPGRRLRRADSQRREAGRPTGPCRLIKFELVLNLKTGQTLGLDIPPTLLALADEVIE